VNAIAAGLGEGGGRCGEAIIEPEQRRLLVPGLADIRRVGDPGSTQRRSQERGEGYATSVNRVEVGGGKHRGPGCEAQALG
jgi:hypothetical protein